MLQHLSRWMTDGLSCSKGMSSHLSLSIIYIYFPLCFFPFDTEIARHKEAVQMLFSFIRTNLVYIRSYSSSNSEGFHLIPLTWEENSLSALCNISVTVSGRRRFVFRCSVIEMICFILLLRRNCAVAC